MRLGNRSVGDALKIVILLMVCILSAQAADNGPNPGAPLTTNRDNASPSPMREGDRIPFMTREETATATEVPSATGLLARTVGALLLVLGLIIAASFVVRRVGGSWFGPALEEAGELSVLAVVSLGDKRTLTAVRFGEQLLLIGTTAQSMMLLASRDRQPPLRSVAELLQDPSEPFSFEQELTWSGQRLSRPLIPQEPIHQK